MKQVGTSDGNRYLFAVSVGCIMPAKLDSFFPIERNKVIRWYEVSVEAESFSVVNFVFILIIRTKSIMDQALFCCTCTSTSNYYEKGYYNGSQMREIGKMSILKPVDISSEGTCVLNLDEKIVNMLFNF